METQANTEQSEAWNGPEGEHWAENPGFYNGMLDAFNDALFEAARIADGDAVLDVGCGTGRTALLAARRAPRGRVLGVDLSAPMLERARADAEAAGLAGRVAFEQGDAQVHPWGEGGFDVAISRGGVMFFADLVAGFAHIREALRPGGRFAAVLAVRPDPEGAYARATAALPDFGHGPSPAARAMMSLADEDRVREVLSGAGFTGTAMTTVVADQVLGRDAEEAAAGICGIGAVRRGLAETAPAERDRIRRELADGLRPFVRDGAVRIPGTVRLVTANA
ncbi:methyltransferase domain-containing protein [Streptomyces albiaxialis]|uniref:Methyltransferase domain-containing protein n=1 Tax=Streptomyces albiaxialis TaxID=329523 RepID=A0ABN2WEJ2_9ACTN